MKALRLFGPLTGYYLAIIGLVYMAAAAVSRGSRLSPGGRRRGSSSTSRQQTGANSLAKMAMEPSGHVDSLGDSLFWLTTAIIGALLTALPVSWTYMAIRTTTNMTSR